MLLTVIVFSMGIVIFKQDQYENVTIYTQGIDDWTSRSWNQFIVANPCPDGYESIGNKWFGTVEGNYTSNGVEKTDPQWRGEIPANRGVWQPQIFPTEVTDEYICGKRTDYSYENVTRAGRDNQCPDGLSPCSTKLTDTLINTDETVCLSPDNMDDCPVTQIAIASDPDASVKYQLW